MTAPDWLRWHDGYDDPASSLSLRLRAVQRRVGEALDERPPGPIRVLSMCAGQGRDLIEPLLDHPRRGDVTAVLTELDERNARIAREASADLPGVTVLTADAADTTAYASVVPVHLALVCGVFGNIPDEHVQGTIRRLPGLLAEGATVIWTRHRGEPDLTPAIRRWFGEVGFAEVGFDTEDPHKFAVGTHRLTVPPQSYQSGLELFRFSGNGAEAAL
ncbi:MAG: hypothetical protein JWO79_1777 [Actinomycetia bacterium]|nr:hypothetical protein [Actinomycetes bacterium]